MSQLYPTYFNMLYFHLSYVFFQDFALIPGLSKCVLLNFHVFRDLLSDLISRMILHGQGTYSIWFQLWGLHNGSGYGSFGNTNFFLVVLESCPLCYLSLPPNLRWDAHCLSVTGREKGRMVWVVGKPSEDPSVTELTDKTGPWAPKACPPRPGAFAFHDLPMTRDEHTMKLWEGWGLDTGVASPGPVPLHPHLFLMGW